MPRTQTRELSTLCLVLRLRLGNKVRSTKFEARCYLAGNYLRITFSIAVIKSAGSSGLARCAW